MEALESVPVVTGASSGFGKAIALSVSAEGLSRPWSLAAANSWKLLRSSAS